MLFIAYRLEKFQPSGISSVLYSFISLEKWLCLSKRFTRARPFKLEDLDAEILRDYNSYLAGIAKDGRHSRLCTIKNFYRWGTSNGLPGFSAAGLRPFLGVKSKSRIQGVIAKIRHPSRGAFDFDELSQLLIAFHRRLGDPSARVGAQLLYELGIRPGAAVCLKRENLIPSPNPDKWFLMVRRTKRKSSKIVLRQRVISSDLALQLLALQPADSKGSTYLLWWLRNVWPQRDLNRLFRTWAEELKFVTRRLGDGINPVRLPITSYRFRHTLATNLADEGADPEYIAEMLDDDSIGMAAVYVNFSSNVVDLLAKTLDRHPYWYSLLSIWQGEIAEDQDQHLPLVLGGVAHLAGFADIASRIGAIGACANPLPCKLTPPLSCYECPFFRARRDTQPHELQLSQLKSEIDKQLGVESDRIALVLRNSIVAILELISLIKLARGEASAKHGSLHFAKASIRKSQSRLLKR